MSEATDKLTPAARTLLVRIAGGETLFHTAPNQLNPGSYYFAASGEAEQRENVPQEVVNVLRDRRFLFFLPFSDSTMDQWVTAQLTDEGREALKQW